MNNAGFSVNCQWVEVQSILGDSISSGSKMVKFCIQKKKKKLVVLQYRHTRTQIEVKNLHLTTWHGLTLFYKHSESIAGQLERWNNCKIRLHSHH